MFARRTHWNLAPNALAQALERHRAAGKPLLDLTASNPTECGLTTSDAAILRHLADPAVLRYSPHPRGLRAARQAVARYYGDKCASVDGAQILLTTGTSEAYALVLRLLCDPGDEVLIPAPSYPLLHYLGDINDVRLTPYALLYDHGWHIDFASLQRAITPGTRALVVVHPNNPTGHYAPTADLRRLNALCAQNDLALIADEVFHDFSLGKERPPSFAGQRDALTFTLSGLSKICGLPQMKLAWIVVSGPEALERDALARLEVVADAYLSVNTPVQLAAPRWLETRRAFQEALVERVCRNLAELDRQLVDRPSCVRLELEGGWSAILRVPATRPDEDLALALLEARDVYVHPGHFYDFPGEGYLVLSLIVEPEPFSEALRRILEVCG